MEGFSQTCAFAFTRQAPGIVALILTLSIGDFPSIARFPLQRGAATEGRRTHKSTMESVVATQVFMSTSVNANAPVEAAFIPGRSADASSHPIHHPPTTRG